MTGPALRQRHAHNAIHESAYSEAEELTLTLEALLSRQDYDKALQVVPVIMEHWLTRTLRHAGEEEQGLYQEIAESQPGKQPLISALKRDHQLLHLLVSEIQGRLRDLATSADSVDADAREATFSEVFAEILERCKTLLWLNQVHSRTEEDELL